MSLALNLSHEPLTKIPHGKLAMWAFLASELMFFSGFFGGFIVLRNTNYEVFGQGSAHLSLVLALLNQYIEYSAKFADGLFPGQEHHTVFYSFYFLMTGFHALHVIAGMIPMAYIFFKGFTKNGYPYPSKVETLGLYWHFVDLMWIFIFPALYLMIPYHGAVAH